MKRTHWCALLACALAVPSLGQQKTYNWVTGNDEAVRLDPGYYHGGPTFQASAKVPAVRVDVEAERPVRWRWYPFKIGAMQRSIRNH